VDPYDMKVPNSSDVKLPFLLLSSILKTSFNLASEVYKSLEIVAAINSVYEIYPDLSVSKL